MDEESYKKDLTAYIGVIKEHHVKKILGNMTDFHFTIPPDVQIWIDQNIFSLYERIGVEKLALLLNENDFFSSLSVEQTIEESEGASFQTKYFGSEEEAEKWLTATTPITA